MPIDIDNFKGGKPVDSMKEAVKKFLQSNHDKAYLATELFEVVQGRKLKSTADLFEIQGILQTLGRGRSSAGMLRQRTAFKRTIVSTKSEFSV
jgi:hypothetical protein